MTRLAHTVSDDKLTIELVGHIDANNAHQIERALDDVVDAAPCGTVELDCEQLTYLSSAGLRIVLRLAKRMQHLSVINLQSEVYDVFEMTGLTEMLDVSRAMLRVSVEGCSIIGEGTNAVVYRLSPETICKVCRDASDLASIERERTLSRTAFVLGIPTAISFAVVRVGDGYGTVFELLDAGSLAELLSSGAWSVERVAHESAKLLRQLAETDIDPTLVPSINDEALTWVEDIKPVIPAGQYQRLRELFAAIPDDTHMVHGDLHIKNIMVQGDEVLLIDLDTLSHGNAVFELAATYSAYVGYGAVDPAKIDTYLGVSHEVSARLWDLILREFMSDASEEELRAAEDRIRLVSAVRLMGQPLRRGDADYEASRATFAAYGAIISEELERVDSLAL